MFAAFVLLLPLHFLFMCVQKAKRGKQQRHCFVLAKVLTFGCLKQMYCVNFEHIFIYDSWELRAHVTADSIINDTLPPPYSSLAREYKELKF